MPDKPTVVETLYASNFRDVAATLRVLADDIEAGRHGNTDDLEVAIAMNTETGLKIFGTGKTAHAWSSAALLAAGHTALIMPLAHSARDA